MEKLPCEYVVWNVLPSIRKEFAKSLINIFNFNQKQIAEKLNLTPAAISQYLSDKRGFVDIKDKNILHEIDKSAKIIVENENSKLIRETCRICNLLKSTKISSTKKEYTIPDEIICETEVCNSNEILCETTVWNILPIIRKEFAKNFIKQHNLSQKKVAELLGITEPSISRYITGKRGSKALSNKKILKEIQKSTNRIIEGNDKTVMVEICRICNLIKSSEIIKKLS